MTYPSLRAEKTQTKKACLTDLSDRLPILDIPQLRHYCELSAWVNLKKLYLELQSLVRTDVGTCAILAIGKL